MAATKVMTGARAKIYINNQLVGIFETCSYNVNIGTEPIHLLGRFSPDEITDMTTPDGLITVTCQFCSDSYSFPADSVKAGSSRT